VLSTETMSDESLAAVPLTQRQSSKSRRRASQIRRNNCKQMYRGEVVGATPVVDCDATGRELVSKLVAK